MRKASGFSARSVRGAPLARDLLDERRRVESMRDHVDALAGDAQEWLESRDAGPLFSFENICGTLGFDADDVREGLRRWRDVQLGHVPTGAALQQGRAA